MCITGTKCPYCGNQYKPKEKTKRSYIDSKGNNHEIELLDCGNDCLTKNLIGGA